MTNVDSDYGFLLVYAVVGGGYGATEDDPECADWISALRECAAADGLLLEVGFHLDMAGRDFPWVRIARRDGRSFASIREIPDWPFGVEREWRETLEAARRRARVGRFTPPPPEHLRPDLNTLYQDGILLPNGDEDWWLHHWQELTDVSTPTGCPAFGRWVTDCLWAEEHARAGSGRSVEPLAFLSLGDPTG